MSTSDITPDRNEAERFLAALDPGTDQFTFQTFDDDKARRERRKKAKQPDPFAKVLHGTLSEHWKTLAGLNAKGAGIFVTINETDGKGRRTNNNIIRVRAVFADLDGAPLEPVLAKGALKPTIITETSPGHFHVYWRVKKPASEAEAKAVLKQFGGVQKAIAARYGGDPSVHDLARVMRLPGFIHRKGEPFFSHATAINETEPCDAAKVFPPPVDDDKPPRPKPLPPRAHDDLPKRWKLLNTYALDHLDLWVPRLFPAAVRSKQGWRVSSASLGRDLEEDISFTRDGIKDFGVHDMGDPRHGGRTAIDIVQEWNRCDFEAAVRWLCQALGLDARDYLPGERKTITNGGGDPDGSGPGVGGGPAPGPGPKPEPAPSDPDKLLGELNRDNCVVLDGGKAWVLRFEHVQHNLNGRRYSYQVPTYLRTGDFRTLYMNRRVDTGERLVELGQWWLKHPARRQYFGVVFEPGSPPVVDGKLNLWTGLGVEPKRGDWSLMREHIYEVLAARDEAVDEYIINWLAWTVQHPGQQPEAALVSLGKRGTGRGTLGNALCRIFGNHALHISSPHHLTGRFNAHLRQCAFLFADEAYAVSDKSTESQLKGLITESTITIEGKGRDVITAPNHLHVYMASNEDWVIPAGEIERRFVVQEVANDHAQDAAWFEPLYKQLEAGGLEAMLFDLLNRDLGNWHPRQIVRTAALAAQQEESLKPFDSWWLDLLHDGYLPAGDSSGLVISGDYHVRMSEGFLTDNSKRTWFEKRKGLYEQARTSSPGLKKETDAAFGRYLKKRGCVSKRVLRQRGWKFPPLDQCRAKWLERFPLTVWDDPNAPTWQGERDQDDED